MKRMLFLPFIVLMIFSCSTKRPIEPLPEVVKPVEDPIPKYSDMNNFPAASDRNYRRMTRERMEDESDLGSTAGSLWKMEGQTSFLFAENKKRKEGDPTAIKIEGAAMKLMEAKVAVVQDLLKELEKQRIQAEKDKERLAISNDPEFNKAAAAAGLTTVEAQQRQPTAVGVNTAGNETADAKPGAKVASATTAEKEQKTDLKDIEMIPSRIVERTDDGMYRIKGQQYLTINKRPYKVIATGLVRQEDFDDTAVSSGKLLEAQYDIIHIKKVNNE